VLLSGDWFGLAAVRAAPVGLLAGVAGVGIVTSIAIAVAPLGLAATLAVVTGVQLLLAFGLEAAGIAGPRVPVDPLRLLGAALLVVGVLLVFGRR
jgi:bacterial/archaeal transporter family-2 protein